MALGTTSFEDLCPVGHVSDWKLDGHTLQLIDPSRMADLRGCLAFTMDSLPR